jgi:putative FmdB family regulatory protein
MPTYGYACEKCGHEFDEFQSIKAKPLRKCPQCGKLALKRLIGTGAGIIFKGSGFYQTDYRSDSYKKGAEKEKGTGKSSDTKAAKTETKAAATETKPSSGTTEKKKSA